ncbi:MAG TPA: leucine-rich repeat domain-containing protein, partial [SAR202 cluster bacterium]|nr:leucine-rich repeat domain-containing protein [SAR202 cluster bacterium]
LTNLESLYLDENPISDLGPISSLTNLRWVGFWDTNISDLGPLSGLTTLESLSLGGNSISDLSPISSLTNLESLYLDENSISDLSPTSALTNLRWVGFRNNNISNLDPLAALSNLNSLDLYQNEISNLAALQSLTSLTYLEIGENPITDYSPITELCNATNTYCSGVPVLTQTTVSYPTDLTVADLAGGGYGGNYQMNGSYNGRPVWTNPLGGDTGYEPRHIFFSPQQVVSSNGTWVIQSGSPTDEWDAGGYYDCQGLPWEECSPGWEGFKLDVTVEASTAWQEWQDSP